eukprot:6386941-Alexandrium_andersonii.AAC.1
MQSGRSPLCHHGPCFEHSNVACDAFRLAGGLGSDVRNDSLGALHLGACVPQCSAGVAVFRASTVVAGNSESFGC